MNKNDLEALETQCYSLWEKTLEEQHVQFMLQKVEFEADELAKSLANANILSQEGQNKFLRLQGTIEGMRAVITTLKESHYVNTQPKSNAIP